MVQWPERSKRTWKWYGWAAAEIVEEEWLACHVMAYIWQYTRTSTRTSEDFTLCLAVRGFLACIHDYACTHPQALY